MRLGLGLGFGAHRPGAAPVTALDAYLAESASNLFWDFRTASQVGGLFNAPEVRGGPTFASTAGHLNLAVDPVLGAVVPTGNDHAVGTFPSETYDIHFTFTRNASSTVARLFGDESNGVYEAQPSALPLPHFVDGVAVTTRQQLLDALTAGVEHTVSIHGRTMTEITVGSLLNTPVSSSYRTWAMYPSAGRATAEALAVAAVEAV